MTAHLNRPTQTQLRRGEAATWGSAGSAMRPRGRTLFAEGPVRNSTPETGNSPIAAERPKMRLIAWRPITKGTLRGFATVELPIGLKLIDCAVFVGVRGAWASPPAKPLIDKDGRQ